VASSSDVILLDERTRGLRVFELLLRRHADRSRRSNLNFTVARAVALCQAHNLCERPYPLHLCRVEMDFFSKLKSFDSFGKSREHVQVRTLSGATGAQAAALSWRTRA
jgi:O-methyltransferase involved in polyketide biosynthesis